MVDSQPEPSATVAAGERAARNTLARAAAEIVGKLASLVLFAAVGRQLGQEALGIYTFALAYVMLASMPIDLGVDGYLLRETARKREASHRLLMDVLALKLTIAIPVFSISFVLVNLLGYGSDERAAVYVLSLGLLLDSLSRSLESVFNAYELGGLLSITIVVQRVGAAALGLLALGAGYGVVTVAATYSIGALFGFVIGLMLLEWRIQLPRRAPAPSSWLALARASMPFALQDTFAMLLGKIDAVILSLMASTAIVGLYGAAYRLLEATYFVTFSIGGAFAAMYTYLERTSDPPLASVFQRSVKLALVPLVPCAVAFCTLAEPISTLIYGDEFADAADPLRWLSGVVLLFGPLTLGLTLVITRGEAMVTVRIAIVMVVINVILNVLLIPSLEEVGAAIAMLATELVFVVFVLHAASARVGGLDWRSMLTAPLAGGVLMLVLTLLVDLPLGIELALGGALYLAAFVVVDRVVDPGDLRFVVGILRRRLRSVPAA